ncbi:hypothetical protein HDU93_007825 [Gonapodya sp. JEL0774]|nr:hypothetical protein HDU93_007825 [Gonapodya sp. JEL0774]
MKDRVRSLGFSFGCWQDSSGRCLIGQHTGLNSDDLLQISSSVSNLNSLTVVLNDNCDHLHIPSTNELWRALFRIGSDHSSDPRHGLQTLVIDGFTSRHLDPLLISIATTVRKLHDPTDSLSPSLQSLSLRGLLFRNNFSVLKVIASNFPTITTLSLQLPDLFSPEGMPAALACLKPLIHLKELDVSPQWRSSERDCPVWTDKELALVVACIGGGRDLTSSKAHSAPSSLLKLRIASIRGGHNIGPATLNALSDSGMGKRLAVLSIHAMCLKPRPFVNEFGQISGQSYGSESGARGMLQMRWLAARCISLACSVLFTPISSPRFQRRALRGMDVEDRADSQVELSHVVKVVPNLISLEMLGVGFRERLKSDLEDTFGVADEGQEGDEVRSLPPLRCGDGASQESFWNQYTPGLPKPWLFLLIEAIVASLHFLLGVWTLSPSDNYGASAGIRSSSDTAFGAPRREAPQPPVYIERHPMDVKWVLRQSALDRAKSLDDALCIKKT